MVNAHRMKFIVLLFIFTFILIGISMRAFSQDKARWDNVTFTTYPNIFKFFDHNTGKIYVYSEIDGTLLSTWSLEDLGQPLNKM